MNEEPDMFPWNEAQDGIQAEEIASDRRESEERGWDYE